MSPPAASSSESPAKRFKSLVTRGRNKVPGSLEPEELEGEELNAPPEKAQAEDASTLLSFDSRLFRSAERSDVYHRYWKKKPVGLERKWAISQFAGVPYFWDEKITTHGWKEWTGANITCYKTLVREFMANAIEYVEKEGEEKIVSWVRGKTITITPDSITLAFGIRRVPHPEYRLFQEFEGKEWEAVMEALLSEGESWDKASSDKKYLKRRFWPLFDFSSYNILYQGKNTRLSSERAALMYAIDMNFRIDLPSYIMHQIGKFIYGPEDDRSIPFGGLISTLIVQQGLSLTDNLEEAHMPPSILPSSVTLAAGQTSKNASKNAVKEKKGQREIGPVTGVQFKEMRTNLDRIYDKADMNNEHIGFMYQQVNKIEKDLEGLKTSVALERALLTEERRQARKERRLAKEERRLAKEERQQAARDRAIWRDYIAQQSPQYPQHAPP